MLLSFSMFCFVSFDQANVVKWEKAVNDDEKELEKVRNDEQRHMKVMLYIYNITLDHVDGSAVAQW